MESAVATTVIVGTFPLLARAATMGLMAGATAWALAASWG